jgi:probable addiction module antidote protein
MPKKSIPYEVGLHERLKDPIHAVHYIKAAAEDSMEGFLLALRDYAEATQGMSKLAEISDKNRENLYRMLSEEGNPRLDSLWAVAGAMGLKVTVEPILPSGSNGSCGSAGDVSQQTVREIADYRKGSTSSVAGSSFAISAITNTGALYERLFTSNVTLPQTRTWPTEIPPVHIANPFAEEYVGR